MATSAFPEKVEFDPNTDQKLLYKIMAGCIVPRPIGFISTVSKEGIYNAAPFSFFNGISDVPPMVCLSICTNAFTDGSRKDTLRNILDTGDFVANVVSEDIIHAEDNCAKPFPPEVDEIAVSGLTAAPSKLVKSPRIVESPANLECRLTQFIPLPRSTYSLVIGEVVYIHIRKDVVSPEGRIDPTRLRAIGRMAGFTYARTTDRFDIEANIPGMAVRGAGVGS